eukprot:m.73684 g.73684  ORF g.73684 m.73684 type:complete len:272 (-) comp20362_c0_seq2:185-1000(-)
MPLIILCGFPCSGKTRFATKLVEHLTAAEKKVHVVSDHSLAIDPNQAYSSANEEKKARAALKAAVERFISKDVYVIADSLNYIKGFRYELYCIARHLKTPHCVVHAASSVNECRTWNEEHKHYKPSLFDEIVQRFEFPDDRNRWDRPLFAVESSQEFPLDEIVEALGENATAAKPVLATQSQPLSDTDFIYQLDRITQDLIKSLLQSQASAVIGDALTVPGTTEKVNFTRKLPMSELRRLRRQFVQVTKLHPMAQDQIAKQFVDFINHRLD